MTLVGYEQAMAIHRVCNGEASATILKGMVVIWSAATNVGTVLAPDVLKATTGGGLATCCGIALRDILAGQFGEICWRGICDVRFLGTATSAINLRIQSTTTAGYSAAGATNAYGYTLVALGASTGAVDKLSACMVDFPKDPTFGGRS